MIKELGEGLYLITKNESDQPLHCNTYLIIEDGQGVLVEPGNTLDYDVIYEDVSSLIDLKDISHVLLTHPDADLTSSMPSFDQELTNYSIITEWRTEEVLSFYGLNASYYYVREQNFMLKLSKKRSLYFYMTPFAHYAGAFVTYDTKTKALLSGDLFGGYSKEWTVFAKDDYVESMAMYHENYMPSSDFIRPIMKQLSSMDIAMICPQHGCVITKDLVQKSINFLYNLDFYNSSNTVEGVRKSNRKYDYPNILSQMVIRLLNLYDENEIRDVFHNTKIDVSFSPVSVESKMKGYNLWNQFFDIIHKNKGDVWLNSLETLVNKITKIYHIKKPESYINRYRQLEEKTKEAKKKSDLLETELEQLESTFQKTLDQQNKCPITGLPTPEIFFDFLSERQLENTGILFIELDQIEEINRTYDKTVGDNAIKTLAYEINNEKSDNELLFRANGSGVILFVEDMDKEALVKRAAEIRNMIKDSNSFIQSVTVGIGALGLNNKDLPDSQAAKEIVNQAYLRVEKAHQNGQGMIVSDQTSSKDIHEFTALLVDEDEININMITKYFADASIKLLHAHNPLEALEMIKEKKIHAIISEINLSKLDGFSLKQKLNKTTDYANIPFIFVSHQKTHDLINRANKLNVDFFLQKPFYPNELIGLIKRMIRQ